MNSRRLLIIGGVLGVVAVVLLNVYLGQVRSEQRSVAVLRLAPGVSLTKGQAVTADMLVTEYLPEEFGSITKVAVPDTPESRAWVVGRRASEDVGPGDFLLLESFTDEPEERFTARISADMRAMTVPVDQAAAVAFFVEPGSRVDVIGTFEQPPSVEPTTEQAVAQTPRTAEEFRAALAAQARSQLAGTGREVRTRTVLQNVRVLAVGQATTRGNYLGLQDVGFSTVTLEVTPMQAEKLAFALSEAQRGLSLALRNPADEKEVQLPTVGWDVLHGEG